MPTSSKPGTRTSARIGDLRSDDTLDQLIHEGGLRIADIDTSKRGELLVHLNSGNTLSISTMPYASLHKASAVQLADWELIADGTGVGWDRLNEHLSLKGFLLTQVRNELADRLRAGIKRSATTARAAKGAARVRPSGRVRVKV